MSSKAAGLTPMSQPLLHAAVIARPLKATSCSLGAASRAGFLT